MANRLAQSTSPYLLQHADNPVDWWEWGPAAFAEAVRRDVPILLSVGYAACHWCHVMTHESFEDDAVAALMNQRFVPVKVDREERPDVDAVYLAAVSALTGRGGWPMTAFLTLDGEVFYGGTYFPPTPRPGVPSFTQVLTAVSDTWRESRASVEEAARRIGAALAARQPPPPLDAPVPPTADDLAGAVRVLAGELDHRHGGFGGAPKFPPSMVCEFLLRHHARTGDERALGMAADTLEAMARGGIHDQLGGGFARYAVDARWVVPHFEKMLYDNALLLRVYAHWWRATGSALAARVVEQTAGFLLRDLRTPEGGFAAALDADTDGVEGLTYVWTPGQLDTALGPVDGGWAARVFGVSAEGTFEHGTSVLQRRADPPDDEGGRLERVRDVLLAARSARPQPARDDKVVAAWNGLAVAAFAEAGALFGRREWVAAAAAAADLLVAVHLPATGVADRVARVSRDGVAGRPAGVLEDHADVAEGWLALYAVTGDSRWVARAGGLLDGVLARFADPAGGFFDTADDGERLVRRPQEPADNATPSGAAAAAGALLTYAALTGSSRHREAAERALARAASTALRHPRFAGWWLAVAEALVDGPREVAVVGHPDDPLRADLARVALLGTAPGLVVAVADPATADVETVPLLAGRPLGVGPSGGVAAAYVCRGFVCAAPTAEADLLAAAVGSVRRDPPPRRLRVRPFTVADAASVGAWRYPGRLSTYDADGPFDAEEYLAVVDRATGELVGFGCLGGSGRVAGQDALDGVLDVGLGLRPELVGAGLGAGFGATVLEAVAALASAQGARRLRAAVLDWNTASLAVCARLGFTPSGVIENREGRFVVLERAVE